MDLMVTVGIVLLETTVMVSIGNVLGSVEKILLAWKNTVVYN